MEGGIGLEDAYDLGVSGLGLSEYEHYMIRIFLARKALIDHTRKGLYEHDE
jgi:hypothetical protein